MPVTHPLILQQRLDIHLKESAATMFLFPEKGIVRGRIPARADLRC